jgi:hypothetical protein
VGDRIVSAPKGAVFVQALLPLILPILYPLPDLPEPLRVARVFYPKMAEFLPRALTKQILILRRVDPWLYVDKTQLELVEQSGGVPIFLPVFADREASQRRYNAFKVEQHFGYALHKVSDKSRHWYARLTTLGSLKNFDIGGTETTKLMLRLTAEMSDPPPVRLPKGCVNDLISEVVRRKREWLRYIDRDTLSNIPRLFV